MDIEMLAEFRGSTHFSPENLVHRKMPVNQLNIRGVCPGADTGVCVQGMHPPTRPKGVLT